MKEFVMRVNDNGIVTAVVCDLVRCRDCKHYRQDGFCTYNNHVQSDPDWFCADGEADE